MANKAQRLKAAQFQIKRFVGDREKPRREYDEYDGLAQTVKDYPGIIKMAMEMPEQEFDEWVNLELMRTD